jgi:TRAP-type C4-dicarboxylate transport system permease small subunit
VEMSESLLAAAIFLALSYAQHRGEHISVDLFTQSFGPRLSRAAHFLALVTTLAVFAFILWRSFDTAIYAWRVNEVSAGIVPVPIWLAKAFAAIGLSIACLETLRQIVWLLGGRDVIAEMRRAIGEEQKLGLE